MKLQYYLRGLGIGIIVTALMMGIVKGRSSPLTDEEIIAMARELGMVESNSMKLADMYSSGEHGANPGTEEPENGEMSGDGNMAGDGEVRPDSAGTSDGGEDPEGHENDRKPDSGGTSDGEDETDSREPSGEDIDSGGGEDGISGQQGVTVEIEPGAGSLAVCRILEEAGLVEDAGSFDRYLIENGYSKRIRMGTYVIVPGTDEEEIARIISREQ